MLFPLKTKLRPHHRARYRSHDKRAHRAFEFRLFTGGDFAAQVVNGGSIQTVLRYEDGSAMQLTIGHFHVAGGGRVPGWQNDVPIDVAIGLDVPLSAGPDVPDWMNAAAQVLGR